MKTVETAFINPEQVREVLQSFWTEMLEVTPHGKGLLIALPLSYPDGMQVILYLEPLAKETARLSDQGRTLTQLFEVGLNYQSAQSRTHALLKERLEAFEIVQDGLELFRQVPIPPQGIDLHLFGEALVSVSHLFYRHDPVTAQGAAIYQNVESVFQRRKHPFQRSRKLKGQTRRVITVDYYYEVAHPVALQVITRRGSILGYMEQWGWRWGDLKKANPKLLPAMVYDPSKQKIDEPTKAIGNQVCQLFCSYEETHRLEELLETAEKA